MKQDKDIIIRNVNSSELLQISKFCKNIGLFEIEVKLSDPVPETLEKISKGR